MVNPVDKSLVLALRYFYSISKEHTTK